jgi:hypothetical protein
MIALHSTKNYLEKAGNNGNRAVTTMPAERSPEVGGWNRGNRNGTDLRSHAFSATHTSCTQWHL